MNLTGKIKGISRNYENDRLQLTLEINEEPELDTIKDIEKLSIELKKYRKKRSLDANALLWSCLGKIATELRTDKWEIYLQMLKRYGKYTYICVKPSVVDAIKAQWRECEEIGEVDINGQKSVQMLCYFGSSHLNTKEFSVLLDGVISEMKEMGIETPAEEDMERALKQYGQIM